MPYNVGTGYETLTASSSILPSQNINTPNSSSVNQNATLEAAFFSQLTVEIDGLKKRIEVVENEQNQSKRFYKSVTDLSRISQFALILFLALPVLQLVIAVATVVAIGKYDELPKLLVWLLNAITITTVFDIVGGAFFIKSILERINALEEENKK